MSTLIGFASISTDLYLPGIPTIGPSLVRQYGWQTARFAM
jgi:hypothetical protein